MTVEEAAQRIAEVKASNNVRRALQKLRLATPENFEELQNEVFDAMEKELENLGDMHDKVQQEIDKAIELGQKRIEQTLQKRVEEEVKYQSHREVMAELGTLVDCMEMKTKDLRQSAGLEEGSQPLTPDDVDAVEQVMAEMATEVKSFSQSCTELLGSKAAEMKLPTLPESIRKGWADISQRMEKCKREALTAGVQAKFAATKVIEQEKKAMLEEAKELFKEKLGDVGVAVEGALAPLLKVEDLLEPLVKRKGSEEKLPLCKEIEAAIAAASESIAEVRKVKPETDEDSVDDRIKAEYKLWVTRESKRPFIRLGQFERRLDRARNIIRRCRGDVSKTAAEQVINELKKPLLEKVQAKAASAAALVASVDKAIKEAEKKVEPLPKSRALEVAEMLALHKAADSEAAVARKALADARFELCPVDEGLDDHVKAKLRAAVHDKVRMPLLRLGGMERRLARVANLAEAYQKDIEKKRTALLGKVRLNAQRVLRYTLEVKKLSREGLFALIDSNRDGAVSKEEFIAFFGSADKTIKGRGLPEEGDTVELPRESLATLFDGYCTGGAASIPKAAFISRVLTTHMQVARGTIFSAEPTINEGKKLRLLKVGEVLEVLEGPVKETTAGLTRVRARAASDKLEGWATVAGNAGTVLLKEHSVPLSV